MNDALTVFLDFLFIFGGPALGGYIGYRVSKKRNGSVVLGTIVGAMGGPCLGTIIVFALPATGSGGSGWSGAGRSFGTDERPELGGKP